MVVAVGVGGRVFFGVRWESLVVGEMICNYAGR